MAEIALVRGRPAAFHDTGARIRLSGRAWPYHRAKYGYGNWCWDAFWLEIDVATRLIVWLQGTERWHCETGWTDFYEAFNAEAPLDRIALGAWLVQAAAQERAP